jgi:hypothetical protein
MSVPITPGTGAIVACDVVSGEQHQRYKRSVGAAGAATDFLDKLSGSDIFVAGAAGATRDCSAQGMSRFSLQVKQTGAVTSWIVDLQISLNGMDWITVISHTKAGDGDGAIVFTGTTTYPALYFRANCSAIVLGGGTNVVATILGLP